MILNFKPQILLLSETDFFEFIHNNYPTTINIFLDLQIITAGYLNNIPEICTIHNGEFEYANDGYITLDEKCEFDKYYSKDKSCSELIPVMERLIKDYAIKYHKTFK